MKIAIFSGSFNPIHNGHLAIAREVLNCGAAEELWFLVSPQNPLKNNKDLLPEESRLKMVQLAVEKQLKMKASDFEFHLPLPSYTINTLDKLKQDYPQHQFVLLIGSDNLAIFDHWLAYQRILHEFGLIVYPRPNFPIERQLPLPNTIYINAPLIDISATEIRHKLQLGESVADLIPPGVAQYLKENKF